MSAPLGRISCLLCTKSEIVRLAFELNTTADLRVHGSEAFVLVVVAELGRVGCWMVAPHKRCTLRSLRCSDDATGQLVCAKVEKVLCTADLCRRARVQENRRWRNGGVYRGVIYLRFGFRAAGASLSRRSS